MNTVNIGYAWVLIGDPTVANGAGMTNLGDTEAVSFSPGVANVGLSSAQTGDGFSADAVFSLPSAPTLSVEFYDNSLDLLVEFILGSAIATTGEAPDEVHALGFGSSIKKLNNLPTVVVVPGFQEADGAAAANAIWLPRAIVSNLSDIVYNRLTEGGNANAMTVEFAAARARVDQDDEPIHVDARTGFMGDPAAYGLDWSLPTL